MKINLRKILKSCLLKLPGWKIFDLAVNSALFWAAHARIPKRSSGLFNDHLFFLKSSDGLYGPLRQFISDKQLVKLFYVALFGEGHAPVTLGQVFSYETFCRQKLPERCVIKPTHLSGAISYDARSSDLSSEERCRVRNWFETGLYQDFSREKNYRYLIPSVIFEEYVDKIADLKDYKIFCVDGRPRAIHVHTGRHNDDGHRIRVYDANWKPLSMTYARPIADVEPRPALLDDALDKAARIAEFFHFVRVDVYITQQSVIMGEITNVPGNAHDRMASLSEERQFADLLGLNSMNWNP
jgi:hypothetical protein